MINRCGGSGRRGFTLIALSVCFVVLLGMVGLAVDLDRMYIVKNESQAYVDAVAVAAALELDGTNLGLERARGAANANSNRWNLGQTPFSGTTVEFAASPSGPWQAHPASPANLTMARVRSLVTQSNFFIPAVQGALRSDVRATAIAGQLPQTTLHEGSFPFSPLAHSNTPPDFGLTPGERYTLRWASNPKVNQNVCPGDNHNN